MKSDIDPDNDLIVLGKIAMVPTFFIIDKETNMIKDEAVITNMNGKPIVIMQNQLKDISTFVKDMNGGISKTLRENFKKQLQGKKNETE